MHCHICDREDDLISYDKLSQEFSCCTTCQAVIDDCIAGYEPLSSYDDLLLVE